MASSIIHIAVANELNKNLKRDPAKILIGSIAPDISKLVNDSRKKSHFIPENETDIPDLDAFLAKYRDKLDDDFVLGYFIHLYTDYLWFKYFMTEIWDEDKAIITKLDGTRVKCTGRMDLTYIYNDYTNLNVELLDIYDMDLSIFYNELPKFENIIEEIPMDRLDLIVNKTGVIIENTKVRKDLLFNIDNINKFINTTLPLIKADLEKQGIK